MHKTLFICHTEPKINACILFANIAFCNLKSVVLPSKQIVLCFPKATVLCITCIFCCMAFDLKTRTGKNGMMTKAYSSAASP